MSNTVNKHNIAIRKAGAGAFVETFGVALLVQLFAFVQGGIVARILGPEGRGELALIVLGPTLISSIGMVGLNRVASREVAGKRAHFPTYIFLVAVLSILGIMSGLFLVSYILASKQDIALKAGLLFLLYVPISQISRLLDGIDHGSGQLRRYNFVRLFVSPLMVTGLVFLWFCGKTSIIWVVIVYLVGYMLPCFVRIILLRKYFVGLPQFGELISIVKKGIPFGFQTAFNEFYLRIDTFLIIVLLTTADLGVYAVSMASAIVLQSVTNSASIVAFSRTARVDGSEDSWQGTAKLLRVCILVKLLLSVFLALLLPFLIPIVYGQGFVSAIVLAEILIWGNLFNGIGKIYEECILGFGSPIKLLTVKVISSVVMIAIAYLLIDRFELAAVAMAYLIAKFVYFILNLNILVRLVRCSYADLLVLLKSDYSYIANKLIRKFILQTKTSS